MIYLSTRKGIDMLVREKEVQTLEKGERIVFQRGQDTEQQVATVRSIEVDGKYVTIWYNSESGEVSFALAETGDNIYITTKARK
jgi:hypothetical protein